MPSNHGRALWAPALAALLAATLSTGGAAAQEVEVARDPAGTRLLIDGEPTMVFGMNWDWFPIGTNYSYSLWTQADEVIESALARDMPLMKAMGVNAIRVYNGIPPRWVQHIYETYGIHTILNHPMARYGFTVDGTWIASVDYSDPRLREAVVAEVVALVEEMKGTPGLLMWLLGNENNYGLSWRSFEIEALPEGEQQAARARYLYSLFEEVTVAIKQVDPDHPVAICNGDVQYLDIIAEECRSIDIFGTNQYRGYSARDLYEVVQEKTGLPVLHTEFGADAYNAREQREDQLTQAKYLVAQWQEIYEQSAGKGRVGNAIGGCVFQWTDGWWKFRQEENLDVHDNNASWPNRAYMEDFVEGGNNMNEEWWGITAKGRPDASGIYDVYPRAAYHVLQDAWELDPYAPGTDLATIQAHFADCEPATAVVEASGARAALMAEAGGRIRLDGLRMELETFSTGGERISTPAQGNPQEELPAFQGFDHLQSFWLDFAAEPSDALQAQLSLNVLGNVPVNPIDQIFYENRGQRVDIEAGNGTVTLEDVERVKVYSASVKWEDPWYSLDGFYRTGHLHWGFEGDFFGLYRDAYYGENLDIYNGIAPIGVEVDLKRQLSGLTLAFGPQLWWGANPQYMLKYNRQVGRLATTAMFANEFARQSSASSSIAVPVPPTQKAALSAQTSWRGIGIELGGLWAGDDEVGETFTAVQDGAAVVDEIRAGDTFGIKGKLSWQGGPCNWYAQAAHMGLVADAGPDPTVTYTGWTLKDSGASNQENFLTGLAWNVGNFQLGPNFLWQKPLVGPNPDDGPPAARPRSVITDQFAVLGNREMVAGEFMLTYDPEPATWLWMWDNDLREGAPFAGSLGFVFRHMPTTRDANVYVSGDGQLFVFPGAPDAHDEWELNARFVSRISPRTRLVGGAWYGDGIESRSESDRLLSRFGANARLVSGRMSYEALVKVNDWGPYDYHRDFNLTFPLQLIGDVSRSLSSPSWFGLPDTRIGVRGTLRTLDQNSPRYCPERVRNVSGDLECDPLAPGEDGTEWEFRTYLHVAM